MTFRIYARVACAGALVISACSRERVTRNDTAADSALPPVAQNAPNGDSLLAAMAAAEESLRVHGDDSAFAALYLRLGRMKRTYEGLLSYGSPGAAYAEARRTEYSFNEVGADYLYNGYHFRELVRRFPRSEWADDAAWELTQVSVGGECEGNVPCYIAREFDPVAEFLRDYPTSPFAPEAVRRANEAFTNALEDVVDLTQPTDEYAPGEVQELLARYDTLAQHLPTELRAQATLSIAAWWVKFLNRERARALYNWLLATRPPGVDSVDIRLRLNALAGKTFVLHPASIISDSRVELSWEAAPSATIARYVVFRSGSADSVGQIMAEVGSEPRTYSDLTAQPDRDYWYRIQARASSEEIASNSVHVATPSAALGARAVIFSPTDQTLYVFGYLENGFPRVLQVSQRNQEVTARDGALFGIERYAQRDHQFDSYVAEAWFVDAASQAFIRFPKAGNTFGRGLDGVVYAGTGDVAVDTAGMPYYGIVVSVNPSTRQMWVARRGQAYSLAWDYKRGIAWEGREGGIRQLDRAGKVIREIALERRSSVENEFVTGIWADIRSGAAWAFLSRKGALIRIDSAGVITQTLQLEPHGGDEPRWIAFDFAHGWVWVVMGGVAARSLAQFALADGRKLRSSRLAGALIPSLAPDTTTGRLWLLDGNRLANFDSTGTLVFQMTVPTQR